MHYQIRADRVELVFANIGKAGAVFHVYDKHRLAQRPRRYTVEAGKELRGHWAANDEGAYDLWVLGPNGFHRHFCGSTKGAVAEPAMRAAYGAGTIAIALANPGTAPLACTVTENTYAQVAWNTTVLPGATAVRVFQLPDSGNWYDLSLRVAALPNYQRRLAGRVETGVDDISDPAMGS